MRFPDHAQSVQRREGKTDFWLLGGTGEKNYEDSTLPAGIDGATYIVTTQCGEVSGPPSQQLSVTFGVAGPGFTISSITAGPNKLLA
jgi:hypothetical protein